jgi:hypothetical protein
MGMLDRYKKKGGFVQLLNLIETTGKEKAEKFLKLIAEENPVWEAEIRKKVLTLDRMTTWNQTYLMEVLPHLTPNVVATAIFSMPPEKQQIFLGAMPFSERRKAEDIMKETKPNAGEIAACQMKLLNEVRNMVAQGHLKFEKVDPDLVVAENIEESLNSGMGSVSLSASLDMGGDHPPVAASGPAPAGVPANVQEEILQLRRRVMALTQENQLLKGQLQTLKDKLESVRKAAA